ncbi:hypothetical protein A3K86_19150 [Photobacterium jeanii]|uniref:Porin domain-containing protein n=1 Tax=Photobacterium jeanii TaxID=858640 RepID=A0A178K2Z6_9GAMM|nr:porin [Photobacterium jeanii]OAN11092.1 hypothetical protein A3K86_19150 [Photobacterium jeanii]PST90606.1 hypothetical protein C9I91_08250 [Photobacterium jeanii]
MRIKYPLLVMSALPLPLFAAINITDDLSISGFGSTSIAKTNNKAPLFIHREITEDTCYDCDTIFGLQLDYTITEALNASVQVVKRPQDQWSDPEVEWAYLSYEINELTLNGGRLRLPLFLASEYYYVGQAYTWARPPQEVYDSILGFTFYDGFSLRWDTSISDELTASVMPFYGFGRENKTNLGQYKLVFDTDFMAGISADLSGFNYRIHSAYMHTKFKQNGGPEEHMNIFTLGGEYSWDQWQFMAEIEHDKLQTNWYASAAYNIDKFTPYLTYGQSHERRFTKSVTAGVRYDVTPQISLNAEWQGVYMPQDKYEQGKDGQFVIPPVLLKEDKDVQLYTLMVNFVF